MDVKTFNQRAIVVLGLSALILMAYTQFSSLDLYIEDYYYDPQLNIFPWRSTWFAKKLMHGYVKNVIVMIGRILMLVVLLDLIFPSKIINDWYRARLRFVAFAALAVPALVSFLKQNSTLHCPWGITRYHGAEPYLRLFDAIPAGVKAGHCFPAGHATVSLWLAAFCVFWLPHNPKMALKVFCGGIGAGFALGWVQQMRGEHFLSHTLWSMWITALVITLMLMVNKKIIEKNQYAYSAQ
jgi:membrane-associated PAP2 superfamily phosphatase